MGYGQERLKGIVEKEAEEDQQQEEEDIDLTPHEHERALKGDSYFYISSATTYRVLSLAYLAISILFRMKKIY